MGVRMVGFVILGALTLVVAAVVAVRALTRMPSPATPAPSELVGSLATVVTTIPNDAVGEIALTASESSLKVDAVAETSIPSGVTVVVVDEDSPTSVVVAAPGF